MCAATVLLRSTSWQRKGNAIWQLTSCFTPEAAQVLGAAAVVELVSPAVDVLATLFKEQRTSYRASVCSAIVNACQLVEQLVQVAGAHLVASALRLVPALVSAASSPNAQVAGAARDAVLALVRHTGSTQLLMTVLREAKAAARPTVGARQLGADALTCALTHWPLGKRCKLPASAEYRGIIESAIKYAVIDGNTKVCTSGQSAYAAYKATAPAAAQALFKILQSTNQPMKILKCADA